ncbi:MAG: hypothetical protein HY537_05120 [Deltaproteobacteria bacterium]|nr:hypothetical protein [Deltaproteobacteria bacterium]
MRFLNAVFLFFFLCVSLQAHTKDRLALEKLVRLYESVLTASEELQKPGATVCIPEAFCINRHAFSDIVFKASELYLTDGFENESDIEQVLHQLRRQVQPISTLRTLAYELRGWIKERIPQYGVTWVVVTLAFEVAEHSVLFWLPPGGAACGAFQLIYFATAGFVQDTCAAFRTQPVPHSFWQRLRQIINVWSFRLKYRQRLKWLQTDGLRFSWKGYRQKLTDAVHDLEIHLSETSFWKEAFTYFDPSANRLTLKPVLLEDDLTFIFADGDNQKRFDRAEKHVSGLMLLNDILCEIVALAFHQGAISPAHYLDSRSVLGSLAATIRWRYRPLIHTLAASQWSKEEHERLKGTVQQLLEKMIGIFQLGRLILTEPQSSIALMKESVSEVDQSLQKVWVVRSPQNCAGAIAAMK